MINISHYISLFFTMMACHVIGDYILQPDYIAHLKQQDWWKKNCKPEEYQKYKNDWIPVLICHSVLWAVVIQIPLIIFFKKFWWSFTIINTSFHFYIDHQKCNKKSINLVQDQVYHLIQILLTLILYQPLQVYIYKLFNLMNL